MKIGIASPTRAGMPVGSFARHPPNRALPTIPCDAVPLVAPPVAPDAVRTESDRFHCAPYKAVLSARSCVSRQGAAGARRDSSAGGGWSKEKRWGDYALCRDCAVGPQIAKAITS
mgnify:CR=1 FL=1